MTDGFVGEILEAHGGLDRWNRLSKVNVTIVSGGKLFGLINQPQDGTPRFLEVALHEERLSMTPYGGPDKKTNFTPTRIAIEKLDGTVLSERKGGIEDLHNHMKAEGWDALDRAYFNGYANWTYLVTPFLLVLPGIGVKEITPSTQDGEAWKGLRVTFPDSISTHSRVQDFYFGEDYLLRRHDYLIDVAGEFEATQLVSDYKEVDGIKLPTKRRAYKKQADGLPSVEDLMVWIDYSDIHFS
ncbi:MAG: hypothetical protein ABWZ25_00080 [Chitinophagaceae bacterium]